MTKYKLKSNHQGKLSGGIKLVYIVSEGKVEEQQVFLKPYKELLGTREECKKGEWGNTNTPISNVWFKVNRNYEDFNKECISLRHTQITYPELIKHLNKGTTEFNIGKSKEPFKLPISIRIKLFINYIINNFKNNQND